MPERGTPLKLREEYAGEFSIEKEVTRDPKKENLFPLREVASYMRELNWYSKSSECSDEQRERIYDLKARLINYILDHSEDLRLSNFETHLTQKNGARHLAVEFFVDMKKISFHVPIERIADKKYIPESFAHDPTIRSYYKQRPRKQGKVQLSKPIEEIINYIEMVLRTHQ